MRREQVRPAGRDGALAVLRSGLRSRTQCGHLVVMRGPAGIGKTWVLEESVRRWRAKGARVAEVLVAGRAGQDRYGVDAVVDAFRRDFDRFGDHGLIDEINALVRLRQHEADYPNTCFRAVAAELNKVFGRIGPTAVLIDDVQEIADPAALLIAARRHGCLVVASTRTGTGPTGASAELLEIADEVLELGPLTAEDIKAVAGAELDESVHQALRTALGPLYGNPGTVLATLQALRDDGRLVAAGGEVTLADPASPVALPSGHDLLRRLGRLGDLAARLLAAVASEDTLDVDDLPLVAASLGEDSAECGWTVDRLVENGLLVGDSWGRLRCACPALAAAIAPGTCAALAEAQAASVRGRSDADSPVVSSVAPALVREQSGVSPMTAARSRSWSATEERIVELINKGFTNRQIGSELELSEKTVEGQLTRLFAKTGCRSRVALVAKANREGRLWSGSGAMLGRPAA